MFFLLWKMVAFYFTKMFNFKYLVLFYFFIFKIKVTNYKIY